MATALHELQKVYDHDTSPGTEIEAIKAVLNQKDVIDVAKYQLITAIEEAKQVLEGLTERE